MTLVKDVRQVRSGLEEKILKQLQSECPEATYESVKIKYQKKPSDYTPDWVLPNGIIIETKGRFMSSDRVKHLLIKAQHPDLDIRFVFSKAQNRLGKKSKTTYAMWCDKHGFKWADGGVIPREWFKE